MALFWQIQSNYVFYKVHLNLSKQAENQIHSATQ